MSSRCEWLRMSTGTGAVLVILGCASSTAPKPAPREIRITKAIGEVKKAILKGSRDTPVRQAAAAQG